MALEGSLQDMSLVDLIHIFRIGSKTGVLLLVNGGERGVVYVSQGRLVDAVLVRGAERSVLAKDEEAVIQLLQWEAASFVFRHDPSVAARAARIVHDGEWLIMEGMRRRENPLRALPHQQITLDSRLELASLPSSAESGVKLDLDQWRILSQVAISQNVREICEKTDMAPDVAIRTVTELVAIGLVEVTPLPAPPPRPRREPARAAQLQPAGGGLAAFPALADVAAPGRGLLQAIIRRVRSL
jgi:hypothetical protein